MRQLLLGALLCLALAAPAFAADYSSQLELKDEQIVVLNKGKSTPLPQDMFSARPIADTGMSFFTIGEEDGEKYGVAFGLYIFKGEGKSIAFAASSDAEFCSEVLFSPNGKILAMDAGTWLIRSWDFFSFPDMKPMGGVIYLSAENSPSLIWAGNEGVLVSTMDTEKTLGRECGNYDPCGPISVEYYSFAERKPSKLLTGTGLCDYTLQDIESDGVTVMAQELCLPSIADWKEMPPENTPVKRVSVKLP